MKMKRDDPLADCCPPMAATIVRGRGANVKKEKASASSFGAAPRAKAALTIFASSVGGSILALPNVFQRTGLLAAAIMALASSAVVVFSVLVLVDLGVRTSAKSYGDLTRLLFGNIAAVVVELLVAIMTLGVIVSMCIVLLDAVRAVIISSRALDEEPWTTVIAVAMLEAVSLPMSLPTSMDKLVYGSFVCTFAFLFLVGVVWVNGIEALPAWNNSTGIGNSSSISSSAAQQLWTHSPSWTDIGTAAPVVVLAFGCQLQIMSVVQEQIPPAHRRVSMLAPVAVAAVGAMFCLYFSFGAFGVLSQPPAANGTTPQIPSDVILELPGVSATVARVGLGCAILLVIPLVLFPTRQVGGSVPAYGPVHAILETNTCEVRMCVCLCVSLRRQAILSIGYKCARQLALKRKQQSPTRPATVVTTAATDQASTVAVTDINDDSTSRYSDNSKYKVGLPSNDADDTNDVGPGIDFRDMSCLQRAVHILVTIAILQVRTGACVRACRSGWLLTDQKADPSYTRLFVRWG